MITKYEPKIRKGYFALKQFAVKQTENEMKVCTDSLLFGSMLNFEAFQDDDFSVLDIGTGTGLLALQCAQLNPKAQITAIEIDELSAKEALFNFTQSLFAERLEILLGDAIHYPFTKKFDVIICNPPFFLNALNSPKEAVNRVRHIASLNFSTLLSVVERNLSPNPKSIFAMLMAKEEMDAFLMLTSNSTLYAVQLIGIQHEEGSRWFRSIVFFSKEKPSVAPSWEFIFIKDKETQSYSAKATGLLKPFLLQL